jgi:hypothetical protein
MALHWFLQLHKTPVTSIGCEIVKTIQIRIKRMHEHTMLLALVAYRIADFESICSLHQALDSSTYEILKQQQKREVPFLPPATP